MCVFIMNKGIHNATKRMMITLLVVMLGATAWSQTIPLVYNTENTGKEYAAPKMPEPSQLPIIRELPNPLEGVCSFADWTKRRSDIAHMIQHYGIGQKPTVEPHQVKARMEGDTALVVDVTVNGKVLTLRSTIRYPKVERPPYALMIGTSMISLPKKLFENRPIATMTFHDRALLLLGNPDFKWLADDAMLVSAQAAKKVWERFGIADRMGWSIVGGHGHCQLPESQWPEVQAFIDRFLLGRDTNTNDIRVYSK